MELAMTPAVYTLPHHCGHWEIDNVAVILSVLSPELINSPKDGSLWLVFNCTLKAVYD